MSDNRTPGLEALVECRALAIAAVVILALPMLANGQPPEREGGRGMFRPMPLMVALDTDEDGELSAAEIEEAAVHLKKLDVNKDGKLTREELRPAGGFGGGPGGGRGGEEMATRLMEYDTDKDGKLKAEDLPERMRGIVARADTDKDGFVTKDELTAMAGAEGGQRRGGERGEGRRDRERGEGPREGGEGDGPRRGERPEGSGGRRPPVEE